MKTSQIKSLAGASILSLFLTGCIRANGGVELPPGSVISANKVENFRCGWRSTPAVTADGQKAISDGADFVYSDDGLKTFRKIMPNNIEFENNSVVAYQNKFYAVERGAADYYSSTDGENWTKEGTIAPYQSGDKWIPLFDEEAKSLGFKNLRTGERKYIYNPPEHIISSPSDKPNRSYIAKSNKITIAYDAYRYDGGLSVSLDNGNTWEHVDGLFPEYKNNNEKIWVNVIHCNGIFYLWNNTIGNYSGLSNGYHTSKDGKNWETHRPEIKNMRYITPTDKGLLLIYSGSENKETLIENIETSANKAVKSGVIQKIQNLNVIYGHYYPQINSVVLAGSKADGSYRGALYVLTTEGILTGSGIVDFQCNKQFLAARFGNGLQILATSFLGSPLEYPFVDEPFTITDSLSGRTTLQIGRWF